MLAVIEPDRGSPRRADPLGDQHDLALAREVLEQERELVAAEAGHRVHRAQHRPQAVGELGEQRGRRRRGPSESLTCLKLSTSRNRTATDAFGAARAVERDAEPVEEQGAVGQRR